MVESFYEVPEQAVFCRLTNALIILHVFKFQNKNARHFCEIFVQFEKVDSCLLQLMHIKILKINNKSEQNNVSQNTVLVT